VRTSLHYLLTAAGATLLLGSLATPARAATIILHNFTGLVIDGGNPAGSLTLSGSKLYGMTLQGGASGSAGNGVVFSMNTDGTGFALPHKFTGLPGDGSQPHGSLTLSGSTLYGMTPHGGNGGVGTDGALFSMNTDGTGFRMLHSFSGGANDGRSPFGSLTLSGSKLYGMTRNGGPANVGTVFSMNTDGTGFALLHNFTGSSLDGSYPYDSLTLSASKLYGMTSGGGNSSLGTLFSMNTNGTGFSLLHTFTGGVNDGASPFGSLTLSGSKLYGMAHDGGSNNSGVLFSMNADGTGFALLHSFTGGANDGALPFGSLTLSGSTLYGMTRQGGSNNAGTLFSIDTDGTVFEVLESFGSTLARGTYPDGDLTLSDDGSGLYGMTEQGGTANRGVIFYRAISNPVPEPGTSALIALGLPALLAFRPRSK
jgi:uncharacterized repeat protein (TIGR03803 family)